MPVSSLPSGAFSWHLTHPLSSTHVVDEAATVCPGRHLPATVRVRRGTFNLGLGVPGVVVVPHALRQRREKEEEVCGTG